MAFVNEYIPEADYEKYDLRRICGEHNLAIPGVMHSRHWTIDRERDAFLIKVWSHYESQFSGWAFYWKGEWTFFEMTGMEGGGMRPDGSCWYGYRIKDFVLPAPLESKRPAIVTDLERALADYCGGGVFSTCKQGTATLQFVEE
jgi:hypothetical protein